MDESGEGEFGEAHAGDEQEVGRVLRLHAVSWFIGRQKTRVTFMTPSI